MGADLITCILIGPEKINLTPKKQKEIIRSTTVFVEAAKRAVTDPESGVIDPGSGCYYEENLSQEDKRLLNGEQVEHLEQAASLDPQKVLSEFLHLWKGEGFRDCDSRSVRIGRKHYQVVVAGDRSWGDEPDGDGYQTLKNACLLHIPSKLGIK